MGPPDSSVDPVSVPISPAPTSSENAVVPPAQAHPSRALRLVILGNGIKPEVHSLAKTMTDTVKQVHGIELIGVDLSAAHQIRRRQAHIVQSVMNSIAAGR